ncbi:MAG TPA: hypothetical protein VKT82_18525 [Ktedonobacterales bacterium]|nr:hypothetical protein [Ktedonobacterales bacterium]
MKKWLIASAMMALIAFLSTPTTFAAARGQVNQRATAATHAVSPLVQAHPNTSVISCSGYYCDDVYAYPSNSLSDGSNCGGSWVGWFTGEPEWSKMYYSSTCKTNFAYVTSSPDGSALIEVLLQRRPPGGSPTGHIESDNPTYIPACASGVTIPPSDGDTFCDQDTIPNGAHTWITNMLYAPVDQVQVCVLTVNHPHTYACSDWH